MQITNHGTVITENMLITQRTLELLQIILTSNCVTTELIHRQDATVQVHT